MAELSVRDLVVEYVSAGYRIRPLDGLSFDTEDGELVVLLGPSGCGKTTLLSCLAALLRPTSGEIEFRKEEISALHGAGLSEFRRHTVGVVFQAFNLIPSLSARSNVMVPLRLAGVPRAKARARADELIELVGLGERGHHRPDQMSGGQQQRVAIARALVHEPPMVLADEPTAHLDYIQVEGILRLLRQLASPGRVVLVATHDDRITQLADRVIELTPHLPESHQRPTEVKLDAGDVLFRQGDPSDLVYLVEEGEVEVVRELEVGEERLTVVGPGNYFGELGPMLNLPRSATARALTATVLTSCTVQQFRSRQPGHAHSPTVANGVATADR